MTFHELSDFLQRRMQMSHIYQPAMLLTLLRRGGVATKRDIASEILSLDQSQLEYYDQVVSGMVGRVLRRHGIVTWGDGVFRLGGFAQLSPAEVETLIAICESKLAEYVAKRGDKIWQHRNHSLQALSGTLRYEVLKDAKFRCALCGISAEEKALEVDHILPRKHGGTDEYENLQALCYSCNAMKQDRDATDFRNNPEFFQTRVEGCPFCDPAGAVVGENNLALCLADRFPVTPLHSLVVPKRHITDYFELAPAERNALEGLLKARQEEVRSTDATVTGFNIGLNSGAAAGQTIEHVHIHLIPRRAGDVENPRGGIRGVIPGKADYVVR